MKDGTQNEPKPTALTLGNGEEGPPPCGTCGRTMPNLRTGGIECHHDGSYTTLTSLVVQNELEGWRKLGRAIIGVGFDADSRPKMIPVITKDSIFIGEENITAMAKELLGG